MTDKETELMFCSALLEEDSRVIARILGRYLAYRDKPNETIEKLKAVLPSPWKEVLPETQKGTLAGTASVYTRQDGALNITFGGKIISLPNLPKEKDESTTGSN